LLIYMPVDIQREHKGNSRRRTQNDTKIVELIARC